MSTEVEVLTKEQVEAMEEREEKRRLDGWNQRARENGVNSLIAGQQNAIGTLKRRRNKHFLGAVLWGAIGISSIFAARDGLMAPGLAIIVSDICFVALGAGLAKSYRLARMLHKEI